MTPTASLDDVKKSRFRDYAIRFLFGGLVSVLVGLLGDHFGPGIGGLFLAFPAILPATLTLLKEEDGRERAADDARGARLGAVGLAAFGLAVYALTRANASGALTLVVAVVGWTCVSVSLWSVWYGTARVSSG